MSSDESLPTKRRAHDAAAGSAGTGEAVGAAESAASALQAPDAKRARADSGMCADHMADAILERLRLASDDRFHRRHRYSDVRDLVDWAVSVEHDDSSETDSETDECKRKPPKLTANVIAVLSAAMSHRDNSVARLGSRAFRALALHYRGKLLKMLCADGHEAAPGAIAWVNIGDLHVAQAVCEGLHAALQLNGGSTAAASDGPLTELFYKGRLHQGLVAALQAHPGDETVTNFACSVLRATLWPDGCIHQIELFEAGAGQALFAMLQTWSRQQPSRTRSRHCR